MKKTKNKEVAMKLSKVLLVILIFISLPLLGSDLIEKEFKVNPGEKLDVNLKSGGSIHISGWAKNVARIKVYLRNGQNEGCKIRIEKSGTVIEVESEFDPFEHENCKSPKLEIQVPQRFDLKLKTMGGNITLSNIKGEISGRTMGGSLNLERLKGKIQMTTMGGKISLTDSDIDGQVKTMGGRVLLENVVGDIKGSSMGGNVVYRNVKTREGKSTGKVVKITTMGGSIKVDEAGEGADVVTMGGNIRIKNARLFAKAKTMGGDITIDNIDGWVKATTMGGDVEVTMTASSKSGKYDAYLSSMGGDVALSVPKELSMNIEIELAYTKRGWKKYRIKSDFKLEIEESPDWVKKNGSYRKYIYARAKVKDARHTIKIKTVNGDIYLKKNKK